MNLFLIQLVLAFIVGSFWVTITTIIAEKFGSKIGGLIGGLPSTAVIILFFVGITQSPEVASQATTMIPLLYGFVGLFLIIYALLVRKGLFKALTVSLACFFLLAAITIVSKYENFSVALIIWILLILIFLYVLEKRMKIKSFGKLKIKYTQKQILGRALLSGSIITFGVFMSKMGGPIFGGIFSAFPALFISTLIIIYYSKGAKYSRAMTKTLMTSGMINVVVYSISVRYLYLIIGLIYGTIISLIISLGSAYFTYNVIMKRMI